MVNDKNGQTSPKVKQPAAQIGLRITDQETARAVAIFDLEDRIVGAGCLLNSTEVLTCFHVVELALGNAPKIGETIIVKLIGVTGQPKVELRVKRLGSDSIAADDLALLEIVDLPNLTVSPVQFSTPLRHSGKTFSAFGFPADDSNEQGMNARGKLNAADASDLVQMDGVSSLLVEGGFSGAPVWCPELASFIGIVVSEFKELKVAWCIPSRVLARFCADLPVRFRMLPLDRPPIHDYTLDDPNIDIFGALSHVGNRELKASVRKGKNGFIVHATYACLDGLSTARGKYVTFITHPSFTRKHEDAYELFALIDKKGEATVEFYPAEGFTLAAIGDAGDSALTLDLCSIKDRPRGFCSS